MVHTGIAIPAQVSYVAKVFSAPAYTDPLSAPMFVLARQLSSGYLYKHIRVQGGAYGGMSQYDPMSGTFALLSYRDPNIINTLNVYRKAEEFISQNKISREETGEDHYRNDRFSRQTHGSFEQRIHRNDPRLHGSHR